MGIYIYIHTIHVTYILKYTTCGISNENNNDDDIHKGKKNQNITSIKNGTWHYCTMTIFDSLKITHPSCPVAWLPVTQMTTCISTS